jgi:hypothetical protein
MMRNTVEFMLFYHLFDQQVMFSYFQYFSLVKHSLFFRHAVKSPFSIHQNQSSLGKGTKAGVAKRLMISTEMQTFMKDSKSSRKAAGIPGTVEEFWDDGVMGWRLWMIARIFGED